MTNEQQGKERLYRRVLIARFGEGFVDKLDTLVDVFAADDAEALDETKHHEGFVVQKELYSGQFPDRSFFFGVQAAIETKHSFWFVQESPSLVITHSSLEKLFELLNEKQVLMKQFYDAYHEEAQP